MTFRDTLKAWRTQHGLTQEQAAAVLGIKLSRLQKYEGDRRHPEAIAAEALLKRMDDYKREVGGVG